GKTVIVSSHLMGEIQAVANRIIIIAQGKLLADMNIEEMNQKSLNSYVYVEANDLAKMSKALKRNGAEVLQKKNNLEVRNLDSRMDTHLPTQKSSTYNGRAIYGTH